MCAIKFDNAIVASVMEEAIEFCARKTGLKDREQILDTMRNGDCSVCEYLRYALAKGVAEYLGSMDDTVKAIYIYEPEHATSMDMAIPSRPNLSPGINLIAWVSCKSVALSSVVSSVSSALAEECKQLACPKANALCYQLDVEVADDDEVYRRTGYGLLLNSLYVRPIEIWQR
jgi:CxxC motif-containing protein (DUF1111 family)